jgi:hypothetical protein
MGSRPICDTLAHASAELGYGMAILDFSDRDARLAYTFGSPLLAIRKKIQPTVDSAFDVLYELLFLTLPAARRNQSANRNVQEGESSWLVRLISCTARTKTEPQTGSGWRNPGEAANSCRELAPQLASKPNRTEPCSLLQTSGTRGVLFQLPKMSSRHLHLY